MQGIWRQRQQVVVLTCLHVNNSLLSKMYIVALPVPPSPVTLQVYSPKSLLVTLDMVSTPLVLTLDPSRYQTKENTLPTQSSAEQVNVTLPPIPTTCSSNGDTVTVGGTEDTEHNGCCTHFISEQVVYFTSNLDTLCGSVCTCCSPI